MMRKRDMPTIDAPYRSIIAEHFGLRLEEVGIMPQENTFSINIQDNIEAQKKYKKVNVYGNGYKPGVYDFSETILLMHNGKKILVV